MRILVLSIFSTLLLVGCQDIQTKSNPQENQTTNIIQAEQIESYLTANIGETAFGGNVFCAHVVLANEQQENVNTLYLWALCQEMYQNGQQLEIGTGVSLPVAIILEKQESSWQIMEHEIPRDGEGFAEDIKRIFPQSIWSEISPSTGKEIDDYNNRIKMLENEVNIAATQYFASK
ncbi:MAG: hypothetical protein KC443_12655 [Anaerolineales bacterium]|nr:hypothetical protein [Anaerolineales bacterium]